MRDSITKFDLEAAFKALDEIDTPKAEKGLKANKVTLTERLTALPKAELLVEEYYDIGNPAELETAKEDREAEVAMAKLARIEKIVDLDAETADDLLTSYVGRFIIQCPQCMTLFYKKQEDVSESEDDPNTVNVGEVCQHCGNEIGYTLIGKVGAAESTTEEEPKTTVDAEGTTTEEPAEAASSEDDEVLDLNIEDEEDLDFTIEDDETETNEAFYLNSQAAILNENLQEAGAKYRVSEAELDDLFNSPEFQKPITDSEVRSMLATMSESEDTSEKPESVQLTEAGKLSDILSKIKVGLKTRTQKANWVLKMALEDGGTLVQSDKNELVPKEDSKRFEEFVVTGFADRFDTGVLIQKAPAWDNKNLVLGKDGIQEFDDYAKAEKFAQGWSQRQGGGPAFIYLAKDKTDAKAVFLCEFFKGKLEKDQLDRYVEVVRKDLEGAKLISKSGAVGSEEASSEETGGINTGSYQGKHSAEA